MRQVLDEETEFPQPLTRHREVTHRQDEVGVHHIDGFRVAVDRESSDETVVAERFAQCHDLPQIVAASGNEVEGGYRCHGGDSKTRGRLEASQARQGGGNAELEELRGFG